MSKQVIKLHCYLFATVGVSKEWAWGDMAWDQVVCSMLEGGFREVEEGRGLKELPQNAFGRRRANKVQSRMSISCIYAQIKLASLHSH